MHFYSSSEHPEKKIPLILQFMKKKRFKPQAEQHQDFTIMEISTTMMDYMLAFNLNKHLEIQLSKNDDLPVYLVHNNPVLYSLYFFCKDNLTEYYLIKNLAEQNQLMNSFLLIMRGQFIDSDVENIMNRTANIEGVLYINPINLVDESSNKNKSNKTRKLVNTILTDLEYHMIGLKRKKDETKIKLLQSKKKAIGKLYNS